MNHLGFSVLRTRWFCQKSSLREPYLLGQTYLWSHGEVFLLVTMEPSWKALVVAWILKMASQIWIFSLEGWFFELDAKAFIHTQVCICDMRHPWCIWALTTVYTIVHACFGFQKYLFKWKWNIHELLIPSSSWEEILFLAKSLGTRGNE